MKKLLIGKLLGRVDAWETAGVVDNLVEWIGLVAVNEDCSTGISCEKDGLHGVLVKDWLGRRLLPGWLRELQGD